MTAMTSLAQQLRKLQVPASGAGADDLRGSTASFLFSRKTQLDRETIFAIGVNGLEELEILQPEFARFRETLFDDSSIRLERSIETKETNMKLDAEVTAFLRLLSPFLLLKPAHKALEWLIHRFSIHLYNGDQLMDCAVPYHDTVIFVRIVQLINIDRLPRWGFLLQCQKTGSPLSKLALLNRCQSDLKFLRHICAIVKDAVEVEALRTRGQLRTIVLFYLSAVLGVLEQEKSVSEPLLTTLLPYLVTGLQSVDVPDYVGASYVVLAQLALKVNAIGDVWMPLLEAIFQKTPDKLLSEAISCTAIICKTQEVTQLPRTCRQRLSDPRMRTLIAELSERSDVSSLTRLLLRHQILKVLKDVAESGAAKKSSTKRVQVKTKLLSNKQLEKFTWLVQNVRLTNDDVTHSVRILVTTYARLAKKVCGDQRLAVRMLELLEKRFTGDFDDLLNGEGAERFSNEKSRKAVAQLVQAFLTNPKVASRSANRFLALNHPSAARRMLALKQLSKEKKLDNESFSSFVIERLADDDPEVVRVVLRSKRLIGRLPTERLVNSLIDLLKKCRTMINWKKNTKLCALTLATLDDQEQLSTETQARIISCFLPILFDKQLISISSQILLQGTVPVLSVTLKELEERMANKEDKTPDLVVMLAAMSRALVLAPSPPVKKHLMQLLLSEASNSRAGKNCDGIKQFFVRSVLPLLLSQWLTTETDDDFRNESRQPVLQFIADGLKKVFRKRKSIAAVVLKWDQIDGRFGEDTDVGREGNDLLFALSNLMTIAKLPSNTREMKWLGVATNPIGELPSLLRANAIIFRILTDIGDSEASRLLLKKWSSTVFAEGKEEMLKYLLFLATPPDEWDVSSVASQLCSLHILKSLFPAGTSLRIDNPTVSAVLAASASNSDAVRSTAVATLSELAKRVAPGSLFVGLLKAIDVGNAEIREDGSHLHIVLSSYFKTNVAAKKDLDALLNWTIEQGTPDHIQDKLLFCLTDVDDPNCLLKLIPTLDVILESQDPVWLTAARHAVAQKIIRHFTPLSVCAFRKSPSAFRVFIKALRHSNEPPIDAMPQYSLQMTVLSQITKTMFAAIDSNELQQEVVRQLVDLQVDNDDYVATRKMAKVFRKIIASNGLLVRRELQRSIQPVKAAVLLKETKRVSQKKSPGDGKSLSEDFSHKSTVVILEALHGKLAKATSLDNRIVSALFAHLKRYLERRDPATTEYGKQLVLSALNDALQETSDGDTSSLGQDQFSVELVIDCIRTSSSPKTHQEALLLLALAAKRFPEHVVHNTMAIFTFMGENVVRKDDCASFDVILKTVEAIVPAVVQNDNRSDHESNDNATERTALRTAFALTRVFVDAVPDIPEHRRLPLFSCLVSGMGEWRYLWLTVALVLERLVTYKRSVGGSEKSGFSRLGVLDFSVQLSQHYPPSCQVASCESLVDCLINLPDVEEREAGGKGGERRDEKHPGSILDLERHSPRLRCQFKLMVAEFVSTLLSSRQFLNQVVDLRPDEQEQMMLQYQSLLKKVLTAAHAVAGRLVVLKPNDSALIKYFKVLQHRVYELLDKLSSLLPSNLFVDVIDQLMRDGELLVRHKALEILAAKLQHRGDNLDKPNRTSLKRVVPTLLLIVLSTEDDVQEVGDERMMEPKTGTEASNRQLALLTLKHLCRQLGAEEPNLFRSVLEAATTVVSDPDVDDNVRAAALLYVAEHCHSVRSDAIAHLSAFVPALLSVLDRYSPDAIQKHELLLLSVISALHKVVERLAPFLSPYVADLLQKVCQLSILEPGNPNSPLVNRLTIIRSNLAILVPARVLVPAVKLCFEMFEKSSDGKAIGPLMATLREYVSNADKEQLAQWHSTLFAFFLMALDYRSKHENDDVESVSKIEGCIIEPMLAAILKMSEATFRPLFIKLFDWAVRGDGPSDRVITFYRIADRVADQLKSLFVLFAGHLVKNAAVMLDRNNLSKPEDPFFAGDEMHKGRVLVRYILGCLHKCFLYDNEGFMTKERFETLIQPVVDQLENVHEDDSDDYESLVVDCLAPCIARMAVATSNDTFWKPLNYQVLLKTRHELPKVRFGALQVLRELTKCIGEDYVTLLPETIPFLAELMEDEKVEVEQQCQAVIADMEVVLGEPLQKYF